MPQKVELPISLCMWPPFLIWIPWPKGGGAFCDMSGKKKVVSTRDIFYQSTFIMVITQAFFTYFWVTWRRGLGDIHPLTPFSNMIRVNCVWYLPLLSAAVRRNVRKHAVCQKSMNIKYTNSSRTSNLIF